MHPAKCVVVKGGDYYIKAEATKVFIIVILVVFGVIRNAPAASPTWVEQGPGPTINGQTQGLTNPSNPVSGAINAIATDPTNPNLVYVGTVNGGIWKSTNATSANHELDAAH